MSLGFRVSVGANIALLAVAVVLFTREQSRSSGAGKPPARPGAAELAPPPPKPVPLSRGATPHPEEHRVTREAIARLEKAGISRGILAEVLRQNFRLRWNKRIIELENKYAPKQPPQREYLLLQRLQDDAEIRELKQALGEEGYLAWDKEETLRKLNFEDVPMNPAEADQAYHLQKQLNDKLRTLQMAMEDGDADIADMGTLQMQAQDAYEKDLQKLLGQERYDQLKGYTIAVVDGYLMFNELSPSGDQVNALKGADAEYQAGEAALTKQLKEKPADAATIAAQLQALNDARDANFRKTLGADAYDQLKLEHDATYQKLTQYAGAWKLNESEIEPVYDQVKAFQDNVDRLRQAAQLSELAGQSADWKAINAAIEQSRQQTEASLQNLIGDDRLRNLTRNGLLSPLGSDQNSPHPPPGF